MTDTDEPPWRYRVVIDLYGVQFGHGHKGLDRYTAKAIIRHFESEETVGEVVKAMKFIPGRLASREVDLEDLRNS